MNTIIVWIHFSLFLTVNTTISSSCHLDSTAIWTETWKWAKINPLSTNFPLSRCFITTGSRTRTHAPPHPDNVYLFWTTQARFATHIAMLSFLFFISPLPCFVLFCFALGDRGWGCRQARMVSNLYVAKFGLELLDPSGTHLLSHRT